MTSQQNPDTPTSTTPSGDPTTRSGGVTSSGPAGGGDLMDELREGIVEAVLNRDDEDVTWLDRDSAGKYAGAVLAVVGPELDRLRAEVTGTAIGLKLAIDERDVLRARLAKVEGAIEPFRYLCSCDQIIDALDDVLASVPEPSDSEPAPAAAAFALKVAEQQMCPNCVTPWKCNGPHIEQPAPDADREAGERCTCGAPDAYALTPGETIVHRRDGEPCYIAQSADGASQPPRGR